ncbi:MAG: GAF domain-containing protein [Anaerolineales bacterium]|nr:GAF domain-containing protein [Anaerolineales bacterium]
MTTIDKTTSNFIRIWGLLTEPHKSLTEIRDQNLARLTSLLSVGGLLITLAGMLFSTQNNMTSFLTIWIPLLILTGTAFFFSRSRYYVVASILLVLSFTMIGYLFVFLGYTMLTFMLTTMAAFILASALLPFWVLIILVVIILTSLSLPFFSETVDSIHYAIFFSGGLLLILSTIFRDRIENERVAQTQMAMRELDIRRENLELEVEERTKNIARKEEQIRTAAEISNAINSLLNQEALYQKVVDLLKDRYKLYYAGIFLLDAEGQYAVLKAGTGEAGQTMMAEGHKLLIGGNSMIGQTISTKEARIMLDTDEDTTRFKNPLLTGTRSELALPMSYGGRVIGAITIQSIEPNAFDDSDITALQNIANTVTTALENARLFSASQEMLEDLRSVQRQFTQNAWSDKAALFQELQYSTSDTSNDLANQNSKPMDVALKLRDQVIGEIILEGDDEWTDEEREWIEAVAIQTSLALENARLLEESQQMALRERLIAEITSKIWSTTTIDSILQTAIKELGSALSASEAVIELEITDRNNGNI